MAAEYRQPRGSRASALRRSVLRPPPAIVRRQMNVLFLLRRTLVAVRPVTAVGNIAAMLENIAGQVAADIAIAALGTERPPGHGRKTPMRHAAEVKPPAQHRPAGQNAITAYRPEPQFRTTLTPGVPAIRAAETLARRQVALVQADGGEGEGAHGVGRQRQFDPAENPGWKCTTPCGSWPENESAKKYSGGTPSTASPAGLLNPNWR